MNWRNRQNRFCSVGDFAVFQLRDTEPTEANLKQVAGETWAELERLGYDPIDPFAMDGLHMTSFELGDADINVGFFRNDEGTWSLQVQMIDPGLFLATRDRRLAALDRLNGDLHKVLVSRPELKTIGWFQNIRITAGTGRAKPMS